MTPHGTRQTYQSGCHCTPCRAANASYIAHLRTLKAQGRQPLGILVPAADTAKRIRQLILEQMKRKDIARELGLKSPILQLHTHPGAWLRLRSVLRIRRLHRLKCGAIGSDHASL